MEWAPVYHVKGWGKFNRNYGDFCTGADTILDRKNSPTDLASKSAGLPPAEAPADLASPSREQAERPDHVNDEFGSPVAPKDLIESPEDEATWNAIQKTIRKGNPEDLP